MLLEYDLFELFHLGLGLCCYGRTSRDAAPHRPAMSLIKDVENEGSEGRLRKSGFVKKKCLIGLKNQTKS